MIGKLNHIAIAVRDIGKATAVYRDTLGAQVSAAGVVVAGTPLLSSTCRAAEAHCRTR